MEADLWDARIDLVDMYTRRVSVRKVAVIASQLPPGSRVWQALGTNAAWRPVEYMLADLIDTTMHGVWVNANKDVEKGKRSKPPKPMPRPADRRAEQHRAAKLAARGARFRKWEADVLAQQAAGS